MKTKTFSIFTLLIIFTMIFSACAPAATDTPAEPTKVAAEPTKVVAKPTATEAAPTDAPAEPGSGKTTLGLWTHSAGNPDELAWF